MDVVYKNNQGKFDAKMHRPWLIEYLNGVDFSRILSKNERVFSSFVELMRIRINMMQLYINHLQETRIRINLFLFVVGKDFAIKIISKNQWSSLGA